MNADIEEGLIFAQAHERGAKLAALSALGLRILVRFSNLGGTQNLGFVTSCIQALPVSNDIPGRISWD